MIISYHTVVPFCNILHKSLGEPSLLTLIGIPCSFMQLSNYPIIVYKHQHGEKCGENLTSDRGIVVGAWLFWVSQKPLTEICFRNICNSLYSLPIMDKKHLVSRRQRCLVERMVRRVLVTLISNSKNHSLQPCWAEQHLLITSSVVHHIHCCHTGHRLNIGMFTGQFTCRMQDFIHYDAATWLGWLHNCINKQVYRY